MSDYDRRASRNDPPLSFDDRGPPTRRGPAPVTLIVSVLLLLGVGGGVAWLYRDGVRGPQGPPRPVGASLRDVRTLAPPHPEAVDPAAGLSIYKDDPNAAGAPAFAPPPEQPVARATAPEAAPVVATAPPVAAPPVTPPVKPDAKVAADKPAPKKPLTIEKLIDDPDAAPAAPKPMVKSIVQIGAFSTPALADKAWSDAARIVGGKMAGKDKRVVPLTKDGEPIYRVAITGFASRDEAQAVCARLTAAGKTCFVR